MKKLNIHRLIIILLIISNLFFVFDPFENNVFEKEIDKNVTKYEVENISEEKENEIYETVTTLNPRNEIDSLINLALNKGDKSAYRELSSNLMINFENYEAFYYSFLVANKYGNPDAYLNLYYILTDKLSINYIPIHSTDENTQNFAMYFLTKSYETGNKQAGNKLNRIFGKEAEFPHSSFYLQKISGDNISTP
jgi:hypothetical protein